MDFSDITTQQQLVELLQKQNKPVTDIEPSMLRYAIYVRKSTEEDTKQVRSLEDQLSECKLVAEKHGIFIAEENIIKESASAKVSGIRSGFRKMLDRLIKGELDGIIAWHPDRLSRNMLEAGEIIDLLDKSVIKDLKFASHPFSNDPAGKMLLGILFVMAKQYSEKLSADVTRGNNRSIEDGKLLGYSKHGYIKDRNGMMQPDGNNFAIIQEAFQRKIKGETLQKIAKFVEDAGYFRRGKDNVERRIKITVSIIGKIFSDPVYAGVLKYGNKYVDLTERYDFIPMLTVEDYFKINNYKSFNQAFKLRKSKRSDQFKKADLLNGKVFCNSCGQTTQAGIVRGNTKKYYYFRCETDDCEQKNKGVRPRVIIEFVKDFLSKKPFTSQKAYASYKKEITKIQHQGLSVLNSQIASSKSRIGSLNEDIGTIKSNLAKEKEETIKVLQKEEIIRMEEQLRNTKTLLAELINKKEKIGKAPITFQEFTVIMDALPDKLNKVQSTTEINAIISKIFLNFTVTKKNVVKYTLNQPFDALISKDFSFGDPTENRTLILSLRRIRPNR